MKAKLLVLMMIGFTATPSFARIGQRLLAQQTQKISGAQAVAESASLKTWLKSTETVVKLKGQSSEESANCKTFQIEMDEKLKYQIDCIGQELAETLELKNTATQTITHKGDYLTVTRYDYLTKKPQISQLQQSTLRVPFVQQIIHIRTTKQGLMAFYLESFREDEFGRIVQDRFIQAHSLTNKKLKISANH